MAATDEDFGEEFLALILAVKVVDSYEEAIEHVNRYGSGHSEAIVTGSAQAARAFQLGVDAACVYVNASTRFTDGGEFGMGAEIGNSTQKLHARGPIGLRELCTIKYLVEGDGQARPELGARRSPRRDVQPAARRAPGVRRGGAPSRSISTACCCCRCTRRRTRRCKRTLGRRCDSSCAGSRSATRLGIEVSRTRSSAGDGRTRSIR